MIFNIESSSVDKFTTQLSCEYLVFRQIIGYIMRLPPNCHSYEIYTNDSIIMFKQEYFNTFSRILSSIKRLYFKYFSTQSQAHAHTLIHIPAHIHTHTHTCIRFFRNYYMCCLLYS